LKKKNNVLVCLISPYLSVEKVNSLKGTQYMVRLFDEKNAKV